MGAGTASSPLFVSRTAFFGDEPSPPLLCSLTLLARTLAKMKPLRAGVRTLRLFHLWAVRWIPLRAYPRTT